MKIKKIFINIILCFIFIFSFGVYAPVVYAESNGEEVYLGGFSAGFNFNTRGACVVGLCDVVNELGVFSPSKDAGIQVGDVILYIDNKEVNTALDIEKSIINDNEKQLQINRCGSVIDLNIKPIKDVSGKCKIGVFIRDGINGIGTVSYIKGNTICTLGHPVLDENNKILSITGGEIYKCNITGCVKGEKGKPGELRGVICKKDNIASVIKNTSTGVYGVIKEKVDLSNLQKITTGEGVIGNAKIRTSISNKMKDYDIQIIKCDFSDWNTKNYVIKIIDEELLQATGGIVQGMSGSPIIQNGKLIGAVTHVFINDPTRGFGISYSQMEKSTNNN